MENKFDNISNFLLNTTKNATNNVKKERSEFSKFIYNDTFIVMASAITIGMTSKDMLNKIMYEIVLPIFIYFGKKGIPYYAFNKILQFSKNYPTLNWSLEKLGELIWIILTWFIIIYLTYVIYTRVLKFNIIGGQIDFVENTTKYFSNEKKDNFNLF